MSLCQETMKDLFRLFAGLHVTENVGEDLLERNEEYAEEVTGELEDKDVKAVNIMGAIGSGKTMLIEETIDELGDRFEIAVVAGDVDAEFDSERIEEKGVTTVPVNTGKDCHLDGHLVQHALEHIDLEETDLILVENVGNLICPVDFELGTHRKVTMVSTTEGEDVVGKHPMIFKTSDLALVNKADIADAVDVDTEKMVESVQDISDCEAFSMSLETGENLEKWFDFVEELMEE